MPSDKSDEEIIILYKKGNDGAFKELIDRYTAPLFNFATRLTNKNEAPDIVQEVFVKAWKNIKRFDSSRASFKTWIFTIARNTTTDFLRKKHSLLFSDMGAGGDDENINSFAENIPAEELLPDLVLQKLEESELLNKTLEKLSLNYKEILVLHYQEEMTFEEIGQILGKPLNTVKSSHRRAIIELRKIISPSPSQGEGLG
jgi:RNA polymerase sigma-70 factor (ECF subfamily)